MSVISFNVQNMDRSADVLPNIESSLCCKLTDRARLGMDSVVELITTSQPHFVVCFKPSRVFAVSPSCVLLFLINL